MAGRKRRRKGIQKASAGWWTHHKRSEEFASEAWVAAHHGLHETASRHYKRAAAAERQALRALPTGRPSTYSRIAVSAVSLSFKAGDYISCRNVIRLVRRSDYLLPWAERQINNIERRML